MRADVWVAQHSTPQSTSIRSLLYRLHACLMHRAIKPFQTVSRLGLRSGVSAIFSEMTTSIYSAMDIYCAMAGKCPLGPSLTSYLRAYTNGASRVDGPRHGWVCASAKSPMPDPQADCLSPVFLQVVLRAYRFPWSESSQAISTSSTTAWGFCQV